MTTKKGTRTEGPLKVALVGCGRIGAQTSDRLRESLPKGWLPLSHAEAIKSISGLELVALCDIDEERLSWASETYSVKACYADYKSLISEVKPDILSIATRTFGRSEIIEFASDHGVRGIHSEKPLSRNMVDCKKALCAVARNGVKLTYGTTRRFMDIYRKAKKIMKSGEIGEIVEISIQHGRTLLMWNHPHSVDLLLFLSDCFNVSYVQATCSINPSSVNEKVVDDDPIVDHAFVKFENGINGIITSASGLNTHISGTDGSLIVAANGSWIEIHKKTNKDSPYHHHITKLEAAPEMSGTQRAFRDLEMAVRENKELSIEPEEIALSQNILLCFVLSSQRGGIRLPLSSLEDEFTVTGKFGSLNA